MEEIVIGFDFECAGGVPEKHGFTQLGASAHELSSGKKISGFNLYADMKGFSWEERCVKEFWEKQSERYAETLRKTKESPYSCKEVVQLFIEWVREVSKDRKCVLISDNMIYDGGLIKYFSDVDVMYLLGRRTVFFETASVYYGMYALHTGEKLDEESDNVSSKEAALNALNWAKNDYDDYGPTELKYPTNGPVHDHHPENDAESMVMKWIFLFQNN